MPSRSSEVIFKPLDLTLADIRHAIPQHLFRRSTYRSSLYLLRDLTLAALAFGAATWIDVFVDILSRSSVGQPSIDKSVFHALLWLL